MTPFLLKLFLLGASLMMAYTVFTMTRSMLRRKHIIPANRKEWGSLASDAVTITATVVLLFILENNYRQPMDAVMKYRGGALPAFRFYNINSSKEESLENYSDKIVILNIWATWCPPCRREMPDLENIYLKWRKEGVEIIAISDEDPKVIRDFLSAHPYKFNTAWFSASNDLINSIETRPVSILIRKGKVEDIVVGSRGYNFFNNWLTEK